jgi:exopolysaccharide biosynthesis WecB/TagA/CpsF family protein
MMRVCQHAEKEKIGVYLYGSYQHIVSNLQKNLITRFPKLNVVGWEPSVFRPLTRREDEDLVERINKSGPGIVFIGLGCPLQEKFAFEHKNKIKAVQICVGAAFDFHSGEKKLAPKWMQRCSLEWLFRLLREPKRLWKRYLVTNTNFLLFLFLQKTGIKKYKSEEGFSELRNSGI